jgi:predicted nucleic acid-binding protein
VILYCDTSVLLKLFVDEAGSDWMIKAREASFSIAVCRLTWAESMAAFAQRGRFKGVQLARSGSIQTCVGAGVA